MVRPSPIYNWQENKLREKQKGIKIKKYISNKNKRQIQGKNKTLRVLPMNEIRQKNSKTVEVLKDLLTPGNILRKMHIGESSLNRNLIQYFSTLL